MENYVFTLDFDVRDSECDIQGIVNNAVYQSYLEHARHVFLKSRGIDFSELAQNNVHLVVVRAELDYKLPLKANERFWVGLNLEQTSRLRFTFLQDIYRHPDQKLIMNARIIGTALNQQGRPSAPKVLTGLLEP